MKLRTGLLVVFAILALCAVPAASGRMDCAGDCNETLKKKTGICDATFRSQGSVHYHDTKWLQECLTSAKNNYDNCLSLCKTD